MFSPKNNFTSSLIVGLIVKATYMANKAWVLDHEHNIENDISEFDVKLSDVEVNCTENGGKIIVRGTNISWLADDSGPVNVVVNHERFSELVEHLASWIILEKYLFSQLEMHLIEKSAAHDSKLAECMSDEC